MERVQKPKPPLAKIKKSSKKPLDDFDTYEFSTTNHIKLFDYNKNKAELRLAARKKA